MYKLFLSLRYLRRRRIAFFAIAAVTLCVAMVLIVVSVMGGFLDMVRERARGLLADIIIDNDSLQGFAWYEEFIDHLKRTMPDEVAAATPVILNYGVLRCPDTNFTNPVRIVGVRLDETYAVNDFREGLFYEKHYPGTTTLAEQQQPAWGWDARGDPALPPELAAALKQSGWSPSPQTRATDTSASEGPFQRFFGPGYYGSMPVRNLVAADNLTEQVEALLSRARGQEAEAASELADLPVADVAGELLRRCEQLRERLVDTKVPQETLDRLEALAATLQLAADHAAAGRQAALVAAMEAAVEDVHRLAANLAAQTGPHYVGDRYPGIIIGSDVANIPSEEGDYDRRWPRGHKVLLTFVPLTRKGILSGQQALTKAVRYVDDSRTGVYQIDSLCVYVDFDFAQEVLSMSPQRLSPELGGGQTPARTTQIQIKLAPGLDAKRMRQRIQDEWDAFAVRVRAETPAGPLDPELQQLQWVTVETWEERQRPFITAVEKEKKLVTTLFGVVSIVAVALLGCVFYMIVQEKTRDIGVIKSIGATSAGVASIFLSYGAAVGIVGSVIGTTAGFFFVRYINEIQDLLIRLDPDLRVWSREVYTFDYIPNTVKAFDIGWIVAVAVAASVLGSLFAALRAARVWPVEAIRYE